MESEHIVLQLSVRWIEMKYCTNKILDYTQIQMNSILFKFDYRTSSEHFTRTSPLDFKTTSLLILNMIKQSIKVELMNGIYEIEETKAVPTRQAFTEAREKISYLAFKDFFDKTCELASESEDAREYKGYRIFAVDGTSFVVGKMEKLKSYFGETTAVEEKAMCRISGIVDVLNDCIINAEVSPFSVGERALAIEQIKELKSVKNALYLFDRGYWSPELIKSVIRNKQKFLMRLASNVKKTSITDDNGNEQKLRRYSFILPNGNEEILVTNITEDEMSNEELADLYTKRWGIETKYLELKDRLQINKFSGESCNIVLQDIFCTLYFSNFVAFLCWEADEKIIEKIKNKNNIYFQKANRTICIAVLRNRFIKLCLIDDPEKRLVMINRLYEDISNCVTYIGKSKTKPRRKSGFRSSLNGNVKSIL